MMCKKIIGITGSIATGKSSASNIIKKLGYKVIDSDLIAHELMNEGEINYTNIVNFFGKNILKDNKEIDRKKLGSIVFNNKTLLSKLNMLTHHNIFYKINRIIKNSNDKVIFVDIPLLIELKLQDKLNININQIWLIYVNIDTQLERLMKRDNIDKKQALSKINSQMSIDEKKKFCDEIIDNSKNIEFLEKQIKDKLRFL